MERGAEGSFSTISDQQTERKRKNNCIRQQKHKEKKLLEYYSLIEDNNMKSLQLDSLVEENNAIKKELLAQRQSYDLMVKGSSFGKMNDSDFAELNSYLSVHEPTISSIITGPVKQKDLFPLDGLSDQAGIIAIKEIASHIFSDYLGRQSDAILHQAAILEAPIHNRQKQTWHVDEFAFKTLVTIVHLSEGNSSTYLIPPACYGPDFTLEGRKERIQFDYEKLLRNNRSNAYREEIKARYESLLTSGLQAFDNLQTQPRGMAPGEYQMFRSDLLHAGPETICQRKVLFLCWKVRGEDPHLKPDTQFRIPAIAQICRLDNSIIQNLTDSLEEAGYQTI
jgi:hypothetical protein